MNKDLIFREPIYNDKDEFLDFNYWGFNTDNGSNFSGPSIPTSKIKPKDSERYTGIKDCDDNPIYEGDVIEIDGREDTRRVIFFNKSEAAFKAFYPDDYDSFWQHMFKNNFERWKKYNNTGFIYDDDFKVKVIGNIHEKPELVTFLRISTDHLTEEEINKLKKEASKPGEIIFIKGSSKGHSIYNK